MKFQVRIGGWVTLQANSFVEANSDKPSLAAPAKKKAG